MRHKYLAWTAGVLTFAMSVLSPLEVTAVKGNDNDHLNRPKAGIEDTVSGSHYTLRAGVPSAHAGEAYASSGVGAKPDYDAMAKEMDVLNRGKNHKQVIDRYSGFAVSAESGSANFFKELGIAYRKNGDIQLAINTYHQGIKMNPDDGGLIINLAIAYVWNKDYDNARLFAQKYLDDGHSDRLKTARSILVKYK